jgi:hypothetical protein
MALGVNGVDAIMKVQQYLLVPIERVVFAAGMFLFVYGLVEFLWNIDEGSAQQEGKQHMLWGIVGVFIMVSVVGIIGIIENTFGIGNSSPASTDISRAQNIGPQNFGNFK